MHKGFCSNAGSGMITGALVILLLFLAGAVSAETVTNSTSNLTVNASTSPVSPFVTTQPASLNITNITTVYFNHPPSLVLNRTDIKGLTSTVYGNASPGFANATITTIRWDWGDNSTPEFHGFPYSHNYANPGIYTLMVTALQSDGQSATETAEISVEIPTTFAIPTGLMNLSITGIPQGPAGPASAPVLTLLEPVVDGMNVTLNGNLNAGAPGVTITSVSIAWDDGNVTNVTNFPATYRYAGAGIYTINITGTQSDGQSTTKGITVDIRSDNPGIPGPVASTPPPGGLPVFAIILVTAVTVVVLLGASQWIMRRRRKESALPAIPHAVSLQEEIYYKAKERGDLATSAASAHICARMFRELAEKSPGMHTIYLELAEKWEEIARNTGKTGVPEHQSQKGSGMPEVLPSREDLERICAGTDITPEVIESVLRVAMEIGREGREGQAVGTSFVVGDTDTVLNHSRQFVLNPFQGHSERKRQITDASSHGNIKEFAQLDGAFIVSGKGTVEAAGRYITVDMGQVDIPDGLGSRHSSIAGITLLTKSIGIVVSQSGGMITIFKDGKIVHTINS